MSIYHSTPPIYADTSPAVRGLSTLPANSNTKVFNYAYTTGNNCGDLTSSGLKDPYMNFDEYKAPSITGSVLLYSAPGTWAEYSPLPSVEATKAAPGVYYSPIAGPGKK